jgi:hypothetical protein
MPVLQNQDTPHYDRHNMATIIDLGLHAVFRVAESNYEFIGIFREQGRWRSAPQMPDFGRIAIICKYLSMNLMD